MANQPRLQNIVNARELGRMLGITNATVGDWEARGMPIVKKGSPGIPSQFDSVVCVRWWAENVSGKSDSPPADLADAEKREAIARAGLREMELQQKRGKLVDAAEVERAQVKAFSNVKTALMSIPTAVARDLVGRDNPIEIQEIIMREIRAALTNLARNGVVQEEDLDVTERSAVNQSSGGGIDADAGSQPQRLGRQKAPVK